MDTHIFIYMESINGGYIYLLIDKRNDKKYVGKHNGCKKYYITGGVIPNRIIKKYGKDIFEKIILEDKIINEKVLSEKEIFFIKEYNTFNDGYNLTEGGDGGGSWILNKTKEEIDRIADIKRKKNIGRKFSEETLLKMSKAKKGKPLSEEHKKNIRIAQSGENHSWFGRKHTDETKKKMSEKKIGVKNQKLSERLKINNPNNVKILIENIIYASIKQATEKLELPRHIVKIRLNSNKYPNWIKINNKTNETK